MDFGHAVRQARKSKGLTLVALAGAIGSTANNIWEIERRNSGSMELLARVCKTVGLDWTGIGRGKTLGARLRNRRERWGWSRTTLVSKAGGSDAAVGRVEDDRGHLSTLSAVVDVISPKMGWNHSAVRWGRMPGNRDSRFTPPQFLREVEFVLGGDICLDPCGHPDAAVRAATIYTEDDDGLYRAWSGRRVFANPPYSRAAVWIRRAHRAWADGEAERILLLLPVQTHTKAFQLEIAPVAETFLLGFRIPFFTPEDRVPALSPFGMMVNVFGADELLVERAKCVWRCVHLPPTTPNNLCVPVSSSRTRQIYGSG